MLIQCKAALKTAIEAALNDYFRALGAKSPQPNLYAELLSELEKPLLEHTLRHVSGNQIRAAVLLGINRNTLRKKLNHYNIDANHFKVS